MRNWLALSALFSATVAALAAYGPSQASSAPEARKLLAQVARVSEAEWAAIDRGEALAKILDTDAREIAVAGAVRIDAPRELLIDRYREIENLKRSAIVLDAGQLGRIPQSADLLPVPFEEYSLDLRECRPGECQVRLAEADIVRFHRDVNWRAADRRTRAASVWRDVLAGYATAYMSRGRTALPVYANKPEPLSVAAELELLLAKSSFIASYSREFHAYLKEFGPDAPDGAEQTLYWTKEDFGVRPVIRISHQVIYKSPGHAAPIVIATNQVYADHYLDAALALTLAIDAPDRSSGPSFYMISVSRARTRSLSGMLRRMVRSTVQSRSRDAMRKILTGAKTGLERRPARTLEFHRLRLR